MDKFSGRQFLLILFLLSTVLLSAACGQVETINQPKGNMPSIMSAENDIYLYDFLQQTKNNIGFMQCEDGGFNNIRDDLLLLNRAYLSDTYYSLVCLKYINSDLPAVVKNRIRFTLTKIVLEPKSLYDINKIYFYLNIANLVDYQVAENIKQQLINNVLFLESDGGYFYANKNESEGESCSNSPLIMRQILELIDKDKIKFDKIIANLADKLEQIDYNQLDESGIEQYISLLDFYLLMLNESKQNIDENIKTTIPLCIDLWLNKNELDGPMNLSYLYSFCKVVEYARSHNIYNREIDILQYFGRLNRGNGFALFPEDIQPNVNATALAFEVLSTEQTSALLDSDAMTKYLMEHMNYDGAIIPSLQFESNLIYSAYFGLIMRLINTPALKENLQGICTYLQTEICDQLRMHIGDIPDIDKLNTLVEVSFQDFFSNDDLNNMLQLGININYLYFSKYFNNTTITQNVVMEFAKEYEHYYEKAEASDRIYGLMALARLASLQRLTLRSILSATLIDDIINEISVNFSNNYGFYGVDNGIHTLPNLDLTYQCIYILNSLLQ